MTESDVEIRTAERDEYMRLYHETAYRVQALEEECGGLRTQLEQANESIVAYQGRLTALEEELAEARAEIVRLTKLPPAGPKKGDPWYQPPALAGESEYDLDQEILADVPEPPTTTD